MAQPPLVSGDDHAADAATWLGATAAAARLREHLEPASGRTAWNAFTAFWPIDVALARLCVILGDHERALAYLDASERVCERERLDAQLARIALYRLWARREAGERVDAAPAVAAAQAAPRAGLVREAALMGLTPPA